MTPQQRRFLVINFRIGNCDDSVFVGPILASTSDYQHFHYWDEQEAVLLDQGDYEVVEAYTPGFTLDEAAARFAREFPLSVATELLEPAVAA